MLASKIVEFGCKLKVESSKFYCVTNFQLSTFNFQQKKAVQSILFVAKSSQNLLRSLKY